MSINRCVRVSSSVDFVPNRAATSACTRSSSCSCNALNASSDLANANVSLPVVRLIFFGGVTPNPSSTTANLGLDISSSFSMFASASSLSLRSLISARCNSRRPASKSTIGSTNMRNVRSISFNSLRGKSFIMRMNSSCVMSTSVTQ